jgi:hypothetical protein
MSTTDLVKELVTDTRELLGKEIEAAKIEVREELAHAKTAVLKAAVALGMLLLAAISFTFALAELLARYTPIPMWGSFAIIAAVIGGGAFLFGRSAQRDTRDVDLVPERTARELRHDARFIQRAVER